MTETPPPDDWWTSTKPDAPGDDYTPDDGAKDWMLAVRDTGDLCEATRALGKHVVKGARFQVEGMTAGRIVAMVGVIQDLRRELGQVEAYLAREAGKALAECNGLEGTLESGQTYKVAKSKDRKEWQHITWQADVRRQVMSGLDEDTIVSAVTGEEVNVWALLEAVQAVHGSAAPKVTALKALGLKADDYCESYPGPWTVRIFQPNETVTANPEETP